VLKKPSTAKQSYKFPVIGDVRQNALARSLPVRLTRKYFIDSRLETNTVVGI